MREKTEITGYTSKSGHLGTYKIIQRFTTPEKVKRVKLQSFGESPIEFWVDEDKLCDTPEPVRKPGEKTQRCWECGCEFTRRECQYSGGDWADSYCGC